MQILSRGWKKKALEEFKTFDSSDVIAVFYALIDRQFDVLDEPQAELVLEAIKRSTIDLDEDASVNEISNYIRQYDDQSITGVISNVKGIYHELWYAELENQDEDDIRAELFEATNHPGSDIILINEKTGEREYVQLKATDDAEYVRQALEKNPDIRVISTSELAEKLGIDSTGLSNEELIRQVEVTIEELRSTGNLMDYLPEGTFWATIFSIFPVVKRWVQKEIDIKTCAVQITKITGYKFIKVFVLLALLSGPVTAVPTSVYLIMKYCTMIVRTFKS